MADSILGRFVWHELMSRDPKGAGAFFSKVVGWTLKPWGADRSYTMLMAGKSGMAGLMAVPSNASPPMWLTYVATPDMAATLRRIKSLGGTVLKDVTPIPGVGRFAVVQDPQGAALAVFTPEGGPSGPPAAPGHLDFSWHELATTNAPAAMKFYGKVFGWTQTGVMDMGPQGSYYMYGLGTAAMGGMFTRSEAMPGPPAWLAYIHVPDVRAAARAITRAGGTVINGPMEVPGGDWIVQALDPQGVMFALHSRASGARKTPARKTAARKTTARKTAKRKTAARKTAAPKTAARKTAVPKTAARKTAAPKTAARKTPARKTAGRKTATPTTRRRTRRR